MRITNNMLVNNMIGYISNNLTRMQRYQQQLATGKKISVPSDDPVVAARALRFRTDVANIEQYQKNVKDANSWLQLTDSTLGSMGNIIIRAKELAVQCDGTKSGDDLKSSAKEFEQLRTQLINLANTTYSGRYIFSGYQTDKKLMNDDGSFNINAYNDESINYQLGVSDNININALGGDVFNNGNNAVVSGTVTSGAITYPVTIGAGNNTLALQVDGGAAFNVTIASGSYASADVLAKAVNDGIRTSAGNGSVMAKVVNNRMVLESSSKGPASSVTVTGTAAASLNLNGPAAVSSNGNSAQCKLIQDFTDIINALNSGNSSAVQSKIADLNVDQVNILRVRADVGARQNRAELTERRLMDDNLNFTQLMSENEDADIAEVIMNLQNEENVYRSSLAGGAKVIQPSLVDFLR